MTADLTSDQLDELAEAHEAGLDDGLVDADLVDADLVDDVDYTTDLAVARLQKRPEIADKYAPPGAVRIEPDETPTSWAPVDLDAAGGPDTTVATTDLLERTDGVALLYLGKVHAFVGESESGKTWLALLAARQVLDQGGHVLMLDFEDNASTVTGRLVALGVAWADLVARFHYAGPVEPLLDRNGRSTRAEADLFGAVAEHRPDLVIIDGVTEGMALDGLEPLSNTDVATWYRALPKRIAAMGPAVAMVDHVTKSAEGRGRYAIGAQHKLAGIDGAAYTVELLVPFRPGGTGKAKVTIAKDRPGSVRALAGGRQTVAELAMHHDDDHPVLELHPPAAASVDAAGEFRPTVLMEKLSTWLLNNEGASTTAIRQSGLGRAEYLDRALEVLVAEQWVEKKRNARKHEHRVLKPYRQDIDAKPDDHEEPAS